MICCHHANTVMVAVRSMETAPDPTSARARVATGGLTVPPSAPVFMAPAMMVSSQPNVTKQIL